LISQPKITMMKKLLLFTAAILPLSFLALAGSPETKNNGKPIKESKAKLELKDEHCSSEQALYWFYVDENLNIIYETNPPVLRTKAETGCADEVLPICAEGYTVYSQNWQGLYVPNGVPVSLAISAQ